MQPAAGLKFSAVNLLRMEGYLITLSSLEQLDNAGTAEQPRECA